MFSKIHDWLRKAKSAGAAKRRKIDAAADGEGRKRCGFERLEARELLSADPLQFGAVYYEDAMAGGTDNTSPGDQMHITFEGGAAGTQLSQVTINLNPDQHATIQDGDVFFDTAPGGSGASGSIPLSIVSNAGIDNVQFSLSSNGLDGGQTLTISFVGFDAGDKLVIGFDVDEAGHGGTTPTVEGREFEGSTISGTFTAATYYDYQTTATFKDVYSQATVGTDLDLPADNYLPPNTVPSNDYTAGGMTKGFQESLPITLGGTVYHDSNANNHQDGGEGGIAGVHLELQQYDGTNYVSTGKTATTDANGDYKFDDLDPGKYRVVESQPSDYYSVGATAGTVNGVTHGVVASENVIQEIDLVGGDDSTGNDFAEAKYGSIAGSVYHDANQNGHRDDGEAGVGGAVLELLDSAGNPTGRTATTDSNGDYVFDHLKHGDYSIHEVQPGGYLDGLDSAGSLGGTAHNPGDLISSIHLPAEADGVDYDFGELLPASISGHVFADSNDDCEYQEGETLLSGVKVELHDAAGNLVATTYTDQDGEFKFEGLTPGVYSIVEFTPDGYLDSGDHAGSAGGVEIDPDTIAQIQLGSGVNAVDYHFCEVLPASLQGSVFVDDDNDGVRDSGETGVAGVQIDLVDSSGTVVATTTTGANGEYEFDDLYAGTYSIREHQPSGLLDGKDHVGTLGGTAADPGDLISSIVVAAGQHGQQYDFGEVEPASVSGLVFGDLNENCRQDGNESGIANVVIQLYDSSGNLVRTTTTDADGRYEFDLLPPGTYMIREIQPAGYFQGCTHAGDNGGDVDGDDIKEIPLGSGDDPDGYNFGEVPHASISGKVFQDGGTILYQTGSQPDLSSRDGLLTSDDAPIAGVTLWLTDGNGNVLLGANGQPITAVTDGNGDFTFGALRSGTYGVVEAQPGGYVDGIDHAGSAGGTAHNPGDKIDGITIATGEHASAYHFAEIKVRETVDFNPPPENPPPHNPPPIILGTQSSPIPYIAQPAIVSTYAPNLGPGVPTSYAQAPVAAGGGDDFAWHLSIIDGGQPRGDEVVDNGWTRVTPASVMAHANWVQTDLASGEWTFAAGQGTELNHYPNGLQFGLIDGTPVVGDFDGDGKSDVGVYRQGQWFIDLNANGRWDEGDLWAELGRPDDLPVTGDWDGDGKTDIGVFGPQWEGDDRAIAHEHGLPGAENHAQGAQKNMPPEEHEAPVPRRLLKRTSAGVVREDLIDHTFTYGQSGDLPFSGDWNGAGSDKIGVFRSGHWLLDVNGNGRFDSGDQDVDWSDLPGRPVVGDFDGDGIDDLGLVHEGKWHVDTNHDGKLDALDLAFEHGDEGQTPVVGDWDGDGKAQPGGYRTPRNGTAR